MTCTASLGATTVSTGSPGGMLRRESAAASLLAASTFARCCRIAASVEACEAFSSLAGTAKNEVKGVTRS